MDNKKLIKQLVETIDSIKRLIFLLHTEDVLKEKLNKYNNNDLPVTEISNIDEYEEFIKIMKANGLDT